MDLFSYTDYRAFLKDFYAEQKGKNSLYSYRVFANKAKLGSPNYLKLVIDGVRRITDKNLPNFIRGLRLSSPEAEYFTNLVFYQEAKDQEAKGTYLTELEKLRSKSLQITHEFRKAQQEMFASWYHGAIREMVLLKDFREDPEWISAKLGNKVTAKQVQESLELLIKLECIKREEGRLVLSEPLVTTSDEVSSRLIRDLHRQFIDLGVKSIMQDAISEREINGLTIALPKDRIPEFKKAIKDFRKELNKVFSTTNGNEEIYHLNINFFPLTKTTPTQQGTNS